MMREFFTKNLGLKALSLGLVISLELYFLSPTNLAVEVLRVPVDVLDIPSEMVTTSPPVGEEGLVAELKIRGPGPLVDYAKSNVYRFVVRVPAVSASQQNFALPLLAEQLGLPRGIEVLDISPRVIDLRLEKTLRKEVPIVVQHQGTVAEGCEISEVKATPDRITIWGPESEISSVDRLFTEPINVEKLRGERIVETPLVEVGSYSHFEMDSVRVQIRSTPKLAERSFDNIRIQIRAPQGVASTIEPSKAKAVISAQDTSIKQMSDREIVLYADLDGFREGTHEIPVQAELPDGARLLKVVPEHVRVSILKGREP